LSKELKDIKKDMLSIKMKFRLFKSNIITDEDAKRLKELRKLFRTQQRINIRNKDLEKYKFIEELTKDKNKNNEKFWYSIKKFNNKSNLNKVNISIDLLEKHFKKIFNEKELYLNEFQLNIKKEVDIFEKNIDILNEGVIKFNDVEMDFAIKESKNSKSVDKNDCEIRKKLNDELVILNEKLNKKPEMINIVKFCLENYKIQEHRDNLKVLTRFENQEELYIELN
jgi:hypothetical protein